MPKRFVQVFTGAMILLALCLFVGVSNARQQGDGDANLRVMTFNIRYGTADDGDNHWDKRHEQVVKSIKQAAPDVLGIQEAVDFQVEYLKDKLPDYAFHGVGRDDGRTKGEYAGIFYRKDHFEIVDSSHFWLSESPNKPGSVSWDSSMTRMASWVTLRERASRRQLTIVNTHWDHRGTQARLESARLMRKKIEDIAGDGPVIVTGDFNTTEVRDPYDVLVNAAEGGKPLIDAYRQTNPTVSENEATGNGGFRGAIKGRRIDWILHSDHFKTTKSAIDQGKIDGRYPSDHYPVTATLHWQIP